MRWISRLSDGVAMNDLRETLKLIYGIFDTVYFPFTYCTITTDTLFCIQKGVTAVLFAVFFQN